MSEKEEFTTPYRGGSGEKEPSETGFKREDGSNLNSEGQQGGEGEQGIPPAEQLEYLESQIKRIEQRLAQIKEEKLRQKDEESEQFKNLEDERRLLRKQLIDYDHRHKEIYLRYKRQNQEILKIKQQETQKQILEEQDNIRKLREEQNLARSRRLEQQLEDIKNQSEKRRAEIKRLADARNPPVGDSQIKDPPAEEGQDKKQPSLQEQQIEARHRARVAEIQAELASQRLRRSRAAELEAEIVRIRADYPLYSWWNTYPYSYRLYPYDRLSLYDPLLYPYGRYPYLGSLYPLYPYRRYYPLYPYI